MMTAEEYKHKIDWLASTFRLLAEDCHETGDSYPQIKERMVGKELAFLQCANYLEEYTRDEG